MGDTTIIDIDLVLDVKNDVLYNDDVIVKDSSLRSFILSADDNKLMKVTKIIGSRKRIVDAKIVDNDFLARDLKI